MTTSPQDGGGFLLRHILYPGSCIPDPIYSQLNPAVSILVSAINRDTLPTHQPLASPVVLIGRSVSLGRAWHPEWIVWSRGYSHVSKTCNWPRSWPVTRKSKTSNWPRTGHAIISRPCNQSSRCHSLPQRDTAGLSQFAKVINNAYILTNVCELFCHKWKWRPCLFLRAGWKKHDHKEDTGGCAGRTRQAAPLHQRPQGNHHRECTPGDLLGISLKSHCVSCCLEPVNIAVFSRTFAELVSLNVGKANDRGSCS